jgi:hypothetical protein
VDRLDETKRWPAISGKNEASWQRPRNAAFNLQEPRVLMDVEN